MKPMKRLLSGILAAAMSVTVLSSTFAAVVSAETPFAEVTGTDDYSLSESNSFGSIVMDEFDISKQADDSELEKSNIANISKIVVEGKTAYAAYSCNFDCTLLVGIYDETGKTMYGSANALLAEGSGVISADINITAMPQYFLVKAYIVDSFSNIPVSLVYETKEYTEAVQSFLSKTAADFDADRVVILDEAAEQASVTSDGMTDVTESKAVDYSKITNNYAVYTDNVKVISCSGNVNRLIHIDYKNNYYMVTNPSEECRALQPGDLAALKSVSDWVIVKVSSISSEDENTLVLQGSSDFDMKDVFCFVNVDTAKPSYIQTAGSMSADGYDEVVVSKDAVEFEDTIELYKQEFTIKESNDGGNRIANDTISLNCKISGTLSWTLKGSFKLRFDVFKPEVNSFDISLKNVIGAKLEGTVEFKPDPIEFEVPEIPIGYGFNLFIEPKIEFEIDIKGTIEYTCTDSFGVKGEFDHSIDNYTVKPYSKFCDPSQEKLTLKTEVSLYIGIAITGGISFLDDEIFSVGLTLSVGPEFVASKSYDVLPLNSNNVQHSCLSCYDGDLNLKVKLKFEVKVLNKNIPIDTSKLSGVSLGLGDNAKLKIGKDASLELTVKLGDFYVSSNNYYLADFGTCPNCLYKVTVEVMDNATKAPIHRANIFVKENENDAFRNTGIITNKEGKADIWAAEDELIIRVTKTGKIDSTTKIDVGPDNTSVFVKSTNPDAEFSYGAADSYVPKLATLYMDGSLVSRDVSLGRSHSACITEDGSLYLWGANQCGQLGNGTTVGYCLLPVKIMDNVKAVSLGDFHSSCITEDGSLYMWGYNYRGQLGNGTTENSSTPIKIMDNVKAVSLGVYHSACITEDGSLYMWGCNDYGQLGNGDNNESRTPIKVMDNVKSVSLGGYHSACITEDGSLYMWGKNDYGQLGIGDGYASSTPIKIRDNVKAVSLGGYHSACITEDGSLYMWGYNSKGQLGNGTTENSRTPIKIMDNVKAVSIKEHNSSCMTEDGSLYLWGYNSNGQLGNGKAGTTEYSRTPIKIMDNVKAVSLGVNHSACITDDGSLYLWGGNYYGQLGNGKAGNWYIPTRITITSDDELEEVTSEKAAGTETTASFTGLIPGGVYNFYSVKQENISGSLVNSGNLLYVTQLTADSSGNISLSYTPSMDISSTPVSFVKAMEKRSLADCTVTIPEMTANGSEQMVKPVVTCNGKTLKQGVDYDLAGDYCITAAGSYSLYIIGRGEYKGTVLTKFTVKEQEGSQDITDPVEAFVDRLYTIILGRHAEAAGLADWTNRLKTGTATSAEIVYGIIFSPEYGNKGLSNSEAIERLYQAMLGRASDPEGKQYWLNNLAGGLTITGIINGFSGSQEFGQICASYGIKAGNITGCEPRDRNIGLTGFVSRMYTKALGRNYDVDGLNDWTNRYLTGTATTANIAYGFIFSKEFLEKNLSDEVYVETLYATFFDRPSDATGKADWLNRMHTQNYSREMVLDGFLEAPEFITLREGFGV